MTYEDLTKALDEAREKQDISIAKAASTIYHKECNDLKKKVYSYIEEKLREREDFTSYAGKCWERCNEEYPDEYVSYDLWLVKAMDTLTEEFLAILHEKGKFVEFMDGIKFYEFNCEDKYVDFGYTGGKGLWITSKVSVIVK